jgi:hypothetical protein
MMRLDRRSFVAAILLVLAAAWPAAAQEGAAVPCRDRPCAVLVDWTRSGGIGSLQPDRRYGNPAQLEELIKADLSSREYTLHGSTDVGDLRIVLVPAVRNAICDQMAGTSTDRSCRAITEIQARVEGPDHVREGIDMPTTIRNRCGSDELMPVDKLAVYVANYITYALDGRERGERRPVGRC